MILIKLEWDEVDQDMKWTSLLYIPISQEHDNTIALCVRARGRREGTGGGIRPRGTLRTAGVRGALWGQKGVWERFERDVGEGF